MVSQIFWLKLIPTKHNGYFFKVQSVSSQVVSIPVTNIYKPSNIGGTSNQGMYIPASSSSQLGMSANNPPVVSIKPAETAAGDKNVVQVYYLIKTSFVDLSI